MTPDSDDPSARACADSRARPCAAAQRVASTPPRTASSSSLASQSARTSPIPWAITARAFPIAPLAPAQLSHRIGIVGVTCGGSRRALSRPRFSPPWALSAVAPKIWRRTPRGFSLAEIRPVRPDAPRYRRPALEAGVSGWAWKRRSSGSAYSAAHLSPHVGTPPWRWQRGSSGKSVR